MFHKSKNPPAAAPARNSKTRQTIPTVITSDVHVLGNIVSEGAIDFSGSIDGNIRCESLTLREQGVVKGEINSGDVQIHGTVKGLIRARNVNLRASCKVEGVIIHEQLSIEDGAFVDGKFKRSDRISDKRDNIESNNEDNSEANNSSAFDNGSSSLLKPFSANSAAVGISDAGPKIEAMTNSSSGKPLKNTKMLENIRLIR